MDDGGTSPLSKSQGEAWHRWGEPVVGGVLLIGDHASNHVPADVDLGIDSALLSTHIALDIGVAEVSRLLVDAGAVDAAILGGVSRLVVDCNRDPHAPGLIPISSDGHAIPGNALSHAAHEARLDRYYHPYHAYIAHVLDSTCPQMIVSLHSFTPLLAAQAEPPRPWQVGILYNDDDRCARIAIPAFAAMGLVVGDQQPYSGKLLNHTMNRHAEARGIAYLGIEMPQDEVADAEGQRRFADLIGQIVVKCRDHLAQAVTDRQ